MFSARNRAGVDKSVQLDPILDTIKKPAVKKARQTGLSLYRGRKGKFNKKKEKPTNRSQSQMPSSKVTKKPSSNKMKQKGKSEVESKLYVFNVTPDMIKAN
jgi:hypothetical protein